MRVFVAGATGVIGQPLLPLLVRAGHEVTGTTRSESKRGLIERAGGRAAVLDVYDRDALFAAIAAARPDVTIHLLTDLATSDFAANSRVRREGTRNLVDAALAAGCRRMIAESISWVTVAGDTPSTEDDALDLEGEGSRFASVSAVAALESAVAELPEHVILRFATLYGPGTWYAANGARAEAVRAGRLIANDAVTSFLHVDDAAEATLRALSWPSGVYNIADDEPASAKQWLPVFAAHVGALPPAEAVGREGWERGVLNTKARSQGWSPTYRTWREALGR